MKSAFTLIVLCAFVGLTPTALAGSKPPSSHNKSRNINDPTIRGTTGYTTYNGDPTGQLDYTDDPTNNDPAADPDTDSTWWWSDGYFYNSQNPANATWRVEFMQIIQLDPPATIWAWTVYQKVNGEWQPHHSGTVSQT